MAKKIDKEHPTGQAQGAAVSITEQAVSRAKRVELIPAIERARGSRVLCYICGDRGGAASQIGDDAVRPMYDHIKPFGDVEKVDLFLHSRGGAVEVPWRIVTMLREHCKHLGVLIPYRAYSAATLIALGCDELLMGKKAELGPIDPALNIAQDRGTAVKEEIRVEDVMSFIKFLKDVAGLGDQTALASNVSILTEKLSPWVLGGIYRTHAHIRMVARKLLGLHTHHMEEQAMNLVIESLAEKTYLHGHAIGRAEAREIGLPVKKPSEKLEGMLWELFEAYEELLELRKPIDPNALMSGNEDEKDLTVTIALVESAARTTAFRGILKFRRIRQTPPQVNINLNATVALPPNLDPAALPQEIGQAINQMIQQVQREAPRWVQEQTRRQSPVLRIEGRMEDASWRDITREKA